MTVLYLLKIQALQGPTNGYGASFWSLLFVIRTSIWLAGIARTTLPGR
jgi:hypothetical protein